MVWEDLKPRGILTPAAFDNAITVLLALGGSTNAVIHLLAMAGRAGMELTLERFDQLSKLTPVLANIRPSGKYLMEDFYYAGGLPALLKRAGYTLEVRLPYHYRQDAGRKHRRGPEIYIPDVIRTLENPLFANGGLAVLHGNFAPDGAVIKVGGGRARRF